MIDYRINRLPVVSDGKLVGIVTRADLVRAFTRSDEEIEREIRDDVLLHTLWVDPGLGVAGCVRGQRQGGRHRRKPHHG